MTIYTRNKEGVLTPLKLPVIKGKDGKDGKNGVTPNITLGEVNTLESGEEANVIIKGDKENPILDFNLPKGEEGLNIALSSDKIDRKLKRIDSKVKEIETKNEEQEERIKEVEDKEKKQNFYINGLFNENEDNRVSIEEEGNDIKLESSRKGFVEVDKIVGNTLVNRVSEPMRELTLNGDIDTEGTFVSTTETVENGLVDIVCEGNTIVQLLPKLGSDNWVVNPNHNGQVTESSIILKKVNGVSHSDIKTRCDVPLKKSTTYTLVLNVKSNNNVDGIHVNGLGGDLFIDNNLVFNKAKGIFVFKKTTKNTFINEQSINKFQFYACKSSVLDASIEIDMAILLEGDYTNKPIPAEYFEGMKSVGEQVDGNHKIEVLSKNANENLFKNVSKFYDSGMNNVIYDKENCAFTIDSPQAQKNIRFEEVISKDGIYTLSFKARSNSLCRLSIDLVDKGVTIIEIDDIEKEYVITFDTDGIVAYNPKTYHFIDFVALETTNNRIEITEVKLEEGSIKTPFTQTSNKKEISLNEPLRGLPNGVKDRFVKIDGKWFIERNCYQLILDGSQKNWNRGGWTNTDRLELYLSQLEFMNVKGVDCMICDKMKVTAHSNAIPSDYIDCVTMGNGTVSVFINISKLDSYSQTTLVGKGKAYLQDNPIKLVYQLAKPIYEPLGTAPELSCYYEVTHISNDSLIPCNMVVKNTGFSCRALTSGGVYTAVHNGGEGVVTKVDTTDNMVRLSGKGKKVSDVTVVDGNVSKLHETFKGMKSSFEDKLVTQEMVDAGEEKTENLGKYKVVAKVVGKNLFNPHWIEECSIVTINNDGSITLNGTMASHYMFYITIPKGTYTATCSDDNLKAIHMWWYGADYLFEGKFTYQKDTKVTCYIVKGTYNNYTIKTMMIEEGTEATQYEPYKEYKTSVYLNSPLLKGDEIVMKEDGLYHYHKMEKVVLDGRQFLNSFPANMFNNTFNCIYYNTNIKLNTIPICDRFVGKMYDEYDAEQCSIGGSPDIHIRIYKSKLTSIDVDGFKQWLQDNPLTIIYELAEPFYEKISDNKFITETPNNATLHIDSTIPCQSVKASYTSNVPSVYGLESDILTIEELNVDMIANNFDMDYRILEVEWALEDIGINLVDTRRINNTGLSRFHQAKLLITSGEYDKEKLTCQLSEYLERRYLDQEEFNELIDLMD